MENFPRIPFLLNVIGADMPLPPKHFIESRKEMEEILRGETLGFLGLAADAEPYVVPLTYVYAEGTIIFHCALEGRKLEFLRKNPKVCFTVGRQSGKTIRHPEGAVCSADHDSVICRGAARIIEDAEERRRLLNAFNRRLQPDAEAITPEAAAKCRAVEIRIEEMTGRRWRKGKREYWRHRFHRRTKEGTA
jgi:nitroimidazol reductase NimA-like FMN-containing flavoprotein (pyridoxamine 5'-phosphate oxidase superfamily)